jgi:hypothetical protein
MDELVPVFPCRSIKHIDDLLRTASPCRECGTGNENIIPMTDQEAPPVYVIVCGYCDRMGPWAVSLAEAVAGWNRGKP